ncbi:N-acetyltransferase 10 [Spraguea lophii 42_110]|uniref:N-acetyltransferase 10 n=1 Tax=Spraguea lophii (strain 42_110) TaxID=1358809 RepID=S7WDS0_SPRLO|nr:N-acetyltransferase 10 [Spraguea lophii 42_110]
MHKKKVPDEILYFLSKNVKKNHRSVFVIPSTCSHYVSSLHYLLSKYKISSNVLWIYKKLIIDKKLNKKIMQIKRKQNAEIEINKDDPFEVFISTTDINYVNYDEIDTILGNTYNILVIQDFSKCSPNMLAKAVETIEGGGIIIFMLNDDELYEYEDKKCKDLYYNRFIRALKESPSALFLDSEFNPIERKLYAHCEEEIEMEQIEDIKYTEFEENENFKKIINKCITEDQRQCLEKIYSKIYDNRKAVIGLTADRGRGKSALLGLSLALAIKNGLRRIFVCAPTIQNIKILFSFVIEGLKTLNYVEGADFIVEKERIKKRSYVRRVRIISNNQFIEYLNPNDSMYKYPDLVVIDEAAAIPIPTLQNLLSSNLVFLSSTVQGYEGTGRALIQKLFASIRKQSKSKKPFEFLELSMNSSIRYSKNDPVEKFLNYILLMNLKPSKLIGCPSPNSCDFYMINKKLLFSYHSSAEQILQDLVSIFVNSHYRNSPNDLQLLANESNHQIFTLITPEKDRIPKIIAAVQIAVEGENKKEGNLIPNVIREQFCSDDIFKYKGIRIVRIATHPSYQSMGYGTEILMRLERLFYNNEQNTGSFDNISSNNLFIKEENIEKINFDWIGSSFSLTEKLLNFWKRNKYQPLSIKETQSKSGGHSLIVLKFKNEKEYFNLFRKRFLRLIPSCFNTFPISLILLLLNKEEQNNNDKISIDLSPLDYKRLNSFLRGALSVISIQDIIPEISKIYFYYGIGSLSISQEAVMLMKGYQNKSFNEISKELEIENIQLQEIFSKGISKILHAINKS